MRKSRTDIFVRGLHLTLAILGGLFLMVGVMVTMQRFSKEAYAAPIEPPEGYPKFGVSVKTVTPTLVGTGGETLYYAIEIRNTGAYAAVGTMLTDAIPDGTTYNGDAVASVGPNPSFANGTLEWVGEVGFDSTVIVNFSVSLSPGFSGIIRNTAVISQALISHPVTVTAETLVTDQPILTIDKTSLPPKPGANKPLTYTLVIANQGQSATNLQVTVTDEIPSNTTLRSVGPDGIVNPGGDVVTWIRTITLGLGETTVFTFSVDVNDVLSGTVITNDAYQVVSPESGVTAGDVYTVTVIDPIFTLSKQVWPDPPGSNREMTYTLTLLNQGSLAENLVISDRVPDGVTYVRGGSEAGGVVSWSLSRLDTSEVAHFTYTVYINDVMGIAIVNDDYLVCSAEEVCQPGDVITNVVRGPMFEVFATLDPIAKKPGGGTGPVTPTLVVRNLGPGNAIDATGLFKFYRISVQASDLFAIPAIGTLPPFPDGPDCGDKCVSYVWVGPLDAGQAITFTTIVGQNSQGGEEGTLYTATMIITDSLANMDTDPITGTAVGKITHFANLIPTKSAPPVIARGQLMTYTFDIWNSGLSTDEPPSPWLTDTVPLSVTVVSVSDGGVMQIMTGSTSISWTLPAMSPGDTTQRSYIVRVDDDLVSGTLIINDNYRTSWYEIEPKTIFSITGQPVTTTVQEIGLIDSFKEVTPTLALPGPDNTLTFYLHIVNSSPVPLSGVSVTDLLPWESSTYQRDAIASAGQVYSDIVNINWVGDVDAFSSEVLTFSVAVDPYYQGAITNTATINHPGLLEPVVIKAVAYITDKPVLRITKSASPEPVAVGSELQYTIHVDNLGRQATNLVVIDTLPGNTEYVVESATAGGQLVGNQVRWQFPVLASGERRTLSFRVSGLGGMQVVNAQYSVTAMGEGVVSVGKPVVTTIAGGGIFLPLIMK